MGDTKHKLEQFVADEFIRWRCAQTGQTYQILSRGESPDYQISTPSGPAGLEVTSAYYDSNHAAMLWEPARKPIDAPESWSGLNFDDQLLANIYHQILAKSNKPYSRNCILVIYVQPGLTSNENLCCLIDNNPLFLPIPLKEVFLFGKFPYTTSCEGGYHFLNLAPKPS